MRIVFMGTPDFAAKSLEALYASKHEVVAVFTREDKPKNRGMKVFPPPVKVLALEHGTEVYQPKTLKDGQALETLKRLAPDIVVVVAYGRILPSEILNAPRFGCINVHGSLLPNYRGASPINAALLNGDEVSGITVMQMDKGLDTGDMLLKAQLKINDEDNFESLHDRLATLGASALIQALERIEYGTAKPIPQPEQFSYAPLISSQDCKITLSENSKEDNSYCENAQRLFCKIRAYDPIPGTYCMLGEVKIKLFGASMLENTSVNDGGKLVGCDKNGLVIACAQGTVLVKQVQAAGGKRMASADFFRGKPSLLGETII